MSDRLRVLLVCGSAPPIPCGVGDYTACLARALAALDGVDVGLLTSRWPGRKASDAVFAGVELFEPFDRWTLGTFFAARRAVNRFRPDILNIQWPAQNYDAHSLGPLALWFRRLWHRPLVLTLHEHIQPRMHFIQLAARAADAIVSVRPNFPDGYREGLSKQAAGKPFSFIPNASSLPRVVPTPLQVESLRSRYGIRPGAKMVAYFGLLYPGRGVDRLFEIADPERDHLIVVGGQIKDTDGYQRRLAELADAPPWLGRVTMAGFLPDADAALTLACADAVVLPFVDGGGVWNTSIHGARMQGTFVVSTSKTERGYDQRRNFYQAKPGDIDEMREALRARVGVRQAGSADDIPLWPAIAQQHRELYDSLRRVRRAGASAETSPSWSERR